MSSTLSCPESRCAPRLDARCPHSHARAAQHGFILPENLRPCRLIGNGTAGVVLCCTTESGAMVAVKKIQSETQHGLQRSLREVAPAPAPAPARL